MNEEQLIHLPFPKLLPFYYPDGDGGWILLEDFTTQYTLNNRDLILTVKQGFDYDGASIPRFCRTLVGDKMQHDIIVGALFHDIMYCVHHPLFSRKVADRFIADKIFEYNGTLIKSYAVYNALRTFGGIAWRKEEDPLLSKTIKYAPYLQIVEV